MLNGLVPSLDPDLWFAFAVFFAMTGFFIKAWLNYLAIPKVPPCSADATPPDCMVVIPARNEQGCIGRAVRSFPHDTVIVVDDHSEDGTAEAARAAGAGVLPAPDLAPGVIGKSNACLAGARVMTSRWILFTDADTWVEPGFLDSIVTFAEANGVSFLSVYLRPECETLGERLMGPLAMALFFCGVSARADPATAFNGQCMLVLREAYEFAGGHAPVLSSMFEDVKLAALAQRHRLKFAVARTNVLGHVRLRELWSGIERNAFRFLQVPLSSGVIILLATLAATLWAPTLAWLLMDRKWVAAGLFALVPVALLGNWYRNPLAALLAPFGICAVVPAVFNGLIAAMTGRRVKWKGRTI